MIPVERVITEYEEVRRSEKVPIERVIQDYYAVEYQTEYIPRIIEETVIDYVQQEKTFERVQYLPVETQIIHYPEAELATSQVQVVPSGIQTSQYVSAVPAATTTYTTVPAATTYTTVPATTVVGGGSTVVRSSGVGLATGNVGTTYVTGGPLVYGSGYTSGVTGVTGVPTTTYTTVGGTKGSLSTVGGSAQFVGGTTYQTSGNVVTSGLPVTTTTTTTYQ